MPMTMTMGSGTSQGELLIDVKTGRLESLSVPPEPAWVSTGGVVIGSTQRADSRRAGMLALGGAGRAGARFHATSPAV